MHEWMDVKVACLRVDYHQRHTCMDRLLEPLFERDNSGGRRLVAPRPASKLFNNDGERAQMNAWNDETVKTPSLFNVFLVGRETCVSNDCTRERENGEKRNQITILGPMKV